MRSLLAAALLLPTTALAQPAPLFAPPAPVGLTADEVARRAAETSRAVAARAAESEAAVHAIEQARAGYVPRVVGAARYTRLSPLDEPALGTLLTAPSAAPGPVPAGAPLVAVPLSFPVLVDQYALTASVQVPLSDYVLRLPAVTAAAQGGGRAAALMAEETRLRAATEGRLLYYAWARARLQITVAERALAQARAHLKDVQTAHAAGSASRADVVRVESQVAAAELGLSRTTTAADVLESQLRVAMHDASGRRYELGEDLAGAVPPLPDRPESALVEEALARRLEPRALAESAGTARAQARVARSAGLPRLDAVASAAYANPSARVFPQKDEFRATWDASLQLTWAPTDLFSTEPARKASLARARQLEAERDAVADGVRPEIAQSLRAAREAEVAARTADRGLAAAEESYRVRRVLFQNGRATSVELTDAEAELSRAQLEALGARIDRLIAGARLAHALGLDVGGR